MEEILLGDDKLIDMLAVEIGLIDIDISSLSRPGSGARM
jgi:hypothetical protein